MMVLRIGFTGDVMLGRLVDQHQRRRPVEAVWGTLLEHMRGLDGLFINLECCLSNRGEQWRRTRRPFHFRATPDWAIPALERAGVDACALANNHMLDYEEEALFDTLDALDAADISRAGAGRTRGEALGPAFVSVGDLRVAFLSFTDNTPEFAAGEDSPGTAYIDIIRHPDRSRETVKRALADAMEHDPGLLVVSLHWGPNMVERPPAAFRRFGRWLIGQGVDLIHGHSAHVFQGIEIHHGHPILYDTGDFVDDYAVDEAMRNDRSFLFQLKVGTDGSLIELRLLPTEIYDFSVHEASSEAARWSRERMRSLSEAFGTAFEREGDELVVPLGGPK